MATRYLRQEKKRNDLQKENNMTKEELQNYLIDEAEYAEEEVMEMSDFELVDSYFSYNGVIGYTADFLEVVAAAYGVEIDV